MTTAEVKEWFQIIAVCFTAIGLIVTIIKVRTDFKESREQKKLDLRWKQAAAGKSLNDEMQMDEKAWAAMQMLDSQSRKFQIPLEDKPVDINHSDIKKALKDEDSSLKSVYIRDCFDTLFYFMAMMHHYTETTLIIKQDVDYPINYYLKIMKTKFHDEIAAYIEKYELVGAKKFLIANDF